MIPVRVLAVEHCKIFPAPPRSMNALEFACHPSRFFFWSRQLHDANLFTRGFVWRENFLRKVGAYGILPDDLHRHAQDVRCLTIVLRQRQERESTCLNSSHGAISYTLFGVK